MKRRAAQWSLKEAIETIDYVSDGDWDVGDGLDTLDPKNATSDFKCYPAGCVCSDSVPRPGYGCAGMDDACAKRGAPVRCLPRGSVCACVSRVEL